MYYDSLLGKLIVHAADRPAAIRRALRALGELHVGGIPTTAGFHRRVLEHPKFQSGDFDTYFVDTLQEERHAQGAPAPHRVPTA